MEKKELKDTREKTENTRSHIELRSEKVRNIIGEMPPTLIRWGIFVTVVIFVVLFTIVLGVKYPYGHGERILQHILQKII